MTVQVPNRDVLALIAHGDQRAIRFLEELAAQSGAVGGTLTDGDKGDVIVSAAGATWLLDPLLVASLLARSSHTGSQTVSTISPVADNRLLGRAAGSAGDAQEISVSGPLTMGAGVLDFDEAVALGNVARTTVRKNSGADVGSRRRINLIEGSNVTLTVNDDPVGEEVDVTIAATGGGSAAVETVEVDFTTPSQGRFFDVALVGASPGQQVVAVPSLDMPAGVAEDELEMDPIVAFGRVLSADNIRLFVGAVDRGLLLGKRNINVMVG